MLYLAVSPREAQDAARYPCRLAYAAYRMGPESGLLRQSLPLNTQGGLLLPVSYTHLTLPTIA